MISLLVAGVLVAGCQAPERDNAADAAEEPIAGIDTRAGPIVDLGEVDTVEGGSVGMAAFPNEAGGICLDADDGRAPTCSPDAAPSEGVDLYSWEASEGRACVYGFATTDVSNVVIEESGTGRELADAELLPSSADLGLHVFTGCYEDTSVTEVQLREVTEDAE